MKLRFNINAFAGDKFRPFPQKALEITADAGFRNVELGFDKPYFWLNDLELQKVAVIKTFLKRHNIPGEGNVHFSPILRTLNMVGYKACIPLELYSLWDRNPEKACRKAYQYLMSNFGELFS